MQIGLELFAQLGLSIYNVDLLDSERCCTLANQKDVKGRH